MMLRRLLHSVAIASLLLANSVVGAADAQVLNSTSTGGGGGGTGPQGPAGATGATGATGAQGPAGPGCAYAATLKSATYTVLSGDNCKLFQVTGTATLTLPTPAAGLSFGFMNANATGGGTVTIAGGGATINSGGVTAASSITLSPGQTIFIGNDGPATGWLGSTGPAGPTGATGAAGSAGLIGPGYSAGPYYTSFDALGGGPGASVAAITTTYCSVLYFPNISAAGGGTGTLGSLGTRISTPGTTTFQMGLYLNDATATPNRPGTLIGSTTAVANTSGATGVTSFATGVSVSANTLYWVCLQAGDTTMAYSAEPTTPGGLFPEFVGGSSALVVGSTGNPAYQGVSFPVGTYGNWPSTAHGLTFTEITGHSPWFYFVFASVP